MSAEWAERAAAQLEAAHRFLAQASPGFADAFAARTLRRADDLTAQPYIGAEVPEYADAELREIYEHPFRVLYRVHDGRVQIVAVIHSASRMPRIPPA